MAFDFDVCGCACACAAFDDDDVATMEVDDQPLEVALQPAEASKSDDHIMAPATTTEAMDGEVEEKQAARFITSRQCLLWGVPWVFLFGCMLIFALKYTHGSIWFSAFSAILIAIPITELFFIIYGMTNSDEEPPSPPGAGVGEQLVDSLQYNSTMTDARTEARDKILRCILRGLLLLVWLFMIDLTRRTLTTDELCKIQPFEIPFLIFSVTMLSGGFCMACLMIEGVD